ncbi:hypothetical protein [Chelativorans xinjiangense]|uniref:hypothetical protein n=1 Tax=Chelativorans xinjiangense TaxID=2681485 RepID=UPI0013595740|nr:hypothetical protein [Chelativorans xinjiangense]
MARDIAQRKCIPHAKAPSNDITRRRIALSARRPVSHCRNFALASLAKSNALHQKLRHDPLPDNSNRVYEA